MSAERRARVGDVIAHGETIPANATWLEDAQAFRWERTSVEPLRFRHDDNSPRDLRIDSAQQWWPFTVVEVDPEPQPAQAPAHLLPRAHCFISGDHAAHRWTDGDEPVYCWGDPPQDPHPVAPTSDPGSFADCVAWLIDAGLGTPADRRIDRMAAQHQELQARYDTVVSDRATVKASLERVKQRIRDEREAEPGPLMLTLPEVPAEAVALYSPDTDVRFVPSDGSPHMWMTSDRSWSGNIGAVLVEFGPVTVELAPPRMPRTWSKIDAAPVDVLPAVVTVTRESGGTERWSRWLSSRKYKRDSDTPALSLLELRTLGDVTEVFGDA